MKYFIIININGNPIPMADENESILLFDSQKDAENKAMSHNACMVLGYEIYEWANQ